MRTAIVGSQDFKAREYVFQHLDFLHSRKKFEIILTGKMNRGVEFLVREWAKERGVKVKTYSVNLLRYRNKAGAARNRAMLEDGEADQVIAFYGAGNCPEPVADMITKARQRNLPLHVFVLGGA